MINIFKNWWQGFHQYKIPHRETYTTTDGTGGTDIMPAPLPGRITFVQELVAYNWNYPDVISVRTSQSTVIHYWRYNHIEKLKETKQTEENV
jgi:hypothetical protein